MAVSVRGSAAGNAGLSGNSGTCTFTLPAGSVAGDTAVFGVCLNNGTATYTPPSGTNVALTPQDNFSSALLTEIWARDLTSADITAGSLTVTSSVSGRFSGGMIVLTGTTAASLLVSLVSQNTASTSQATNTVASVPAGSMQVDFIFARAGSTTATGVGTTTGFSQDLLCQTAESTSPNYTTAIEHKTATVSGTIGGESFSTSLSSSSSTYVIAAPSSAVAASASGTVTLGGTATGAAVASASGTVTLGGTAAANATTAAGSITLGGTASASASASAAGSLTLDGLATPPVPPPPPSPPPQYPPLVPLTDQGAQGLMVAVYDRGYTLQGYVNSYTACAVTFQHMDNGAGTLVLPETDPLVPQLLAADDEVVPVTVTDRTGRRWSGRVDKDAVDRGDGQSHAVPGSGVVTVTLVDEWPMLSRMLASPFGASTAMAYGTGAPEFDVRTGALHTVAKGYISDAAARIWGTDGSGNPLGPVAVVPPPVSDGSATVTLQAKWTKLTDLLADPLRSNALTLIVYLWLPGDPQPLGLSLTSATYVVDIVDVNDNPQIVWEDPTFLQRKVALTAPAAFRAVIGGQGSGTAQTFATYTDTDLQTSLGGYGYPEAYFSSSSTSTSASIQQDAATQLEPTKGGLAVQATVQDGVPWTFGQDYTVGDVVGVRALGLDIRQRVVSVQMVDDRDSGYRLLPAVGDDAATLTIQQRLFQSLRALDARVRQLETGF